ncbi:MAG: hypothetical protein LUG86_09580 [Oscillospiraceae bacterium]|nr:hypothetical protein [Oscillospiraceae bacterium]
MVNYRTLKVGDKVHFHAEEFDGTSDWDGTITKTESDHAIMGTADGDSYWIDDDTADMFYRR